MTSGDYRRWATERGINHGDGVYVDCETIAEAEAYVRDYPACGHGFATSGKVEVDYTDKDDTLVRLRATLADAGYTWGEDVWSRDGFHAYAAVNERCRSASIFVRRAEAPVAYATGPGGYLPPGDRPEV